MKTAQEVAQQIIACVAGEPFIKGSAEGFARIFYIEYAYALRRASNMTAHQTRDLLEGAYFYYERAAEAGMSRELMDETACFLRATWTKNLCSQAN